MRWTLPSNSGWQEARWFPSALVEIRGESLVQMSLELYGESWDPVRASAGDYALVPSFMCRMETLLVRLSAIQLLVEVLTDWYRTEPPCEVRLSRDAEPEFWFTLAQREDYISSRSHPICTLTYAGGPMHIQWNMQVDQSCLGILAEGMRDWCESLNRQ